MLPKFSVKNDINAQHYVTVRLNSFGQSEPNTFGNITHKGNCHVDGIEKAWNISANMKKKITEAGFKEGDTFCVMKWKNGAKMGYNYGTLENEFIRAATPMSNNAVPAPQATQSTQQPTPPPPTSRHETAKPDNIQERIIKGMCFNNATLLVSNNNKFEEEYKKTGRYDGVMMTQVILAQTKVFYQEMNDWLKS